MHQVQLNLNTYLLSGVAPVNTPYSGTTTASNTLKGLKDTSGYFGALHAENGTAAELGYFSSQDLAQSTGFQQIFRDVGAANDESCSGTLHLFDPSNTTFVKHFISIIQGNNFNNYTEAGYVAGYVNTTAAITAVQFKIDGENIASGTIKMYGIK